MKEFGNAALAVVGAIIGLAILSVIVSNKSKAPDVIQAGSSALSAIINAAVSPASTAATNSNPGASTFSTPSNQTPSVASTLKSWDDIASQLQSSPNFQVAE